MNEAKPWLMAAGIGGAVSAVGTLALLVMVILDGRAIERRVEDGTTALQQETREGNAQNEKTLGELRSAIADVGARVDAASAAELVDLKKTRFNCYADNTEMTCTITNMTDKPLTTCLRGKLAQKDAAGVTMASIPVCTGRIPPLTTRTLTSPWSGGFAKDMCHNAIGYLDWGACTFTSEPFDPKSDK
jgi:hypothetical protein